MRHTGMAISVTPPVAAIPSSRPTAAPPPPGSTGGLPPSTVGDRPTDGPPKEGLRLRIAHWMENRFGKAAMPIAAVAGGVVGGGLGMLTLGPMGALAGGAAGAFLGALLVTAG
jgi:hypothetical protein